MKNGLGLSVGLRFISELHELQLKIEGGQSEEISMDKDGKVRARYFHCHFKLDYCNSLI